MNIVKNTGIIVYDRDTERLHAIHTMSVNSLGAFLERAGTGKSTARKVANALAEHGSIMTRFDVRMNMLKRTFYRYFDGMTDDDSIYVCAVYGVLDRLNNNFDLRANIEIRIDYNNPDSENIIGGVLTLGIASAMDVFIHIFAVIGGETVVYSYIIGPDERIFVIPAEEIGQDASELSDVCSLPDLDKAHPREWDPTFAFENHLPEYEAQHPVKDEKAEMVLMNLAKVYRMGGMNAQQACDAANKSYADFKANGRLTPSEMFREKEEHE